MLKYTPEYLIDLLNKLNSSNNIYKTAQEALKKISDDICFDDIFLYKVDYNEKFKLESELGSDRNLPNSFDLNEVLSDEIRNLILRSNIITFDSSNINNDIGKALSKLFHTKGLIIYPVMSHDKSVIAFIGLRNFEGEVKIAHEDFAIITTVIETLGNYIEIEIGRNRIQYTEDSLTNVLNNMGIDVYVNDFETNEIIYLNESMAKPYGEVRDMIGKVCWKVLYNDKTCECEFCPKSKLIDEDGNPTKVYSWDYKRPFDGSWFRVFSAAFPWTNGRLAQVVTSVDISEQKNNEEMIRRFAEYDILTKLPNRFRLTNDMDSMLSELNGDFYVIFFDLDGFKKVNDVLGHNIGDELLKKIGDFLQSSPLTHERSYRYGGDEFVIIWNKQCPGTLNDILEYLQNNFSKEWVLDNHKVKCGASIGVSHYPDDGIHSSTLVRNADYAMYKSKKSEKGKIIFYSDIN